MKADDNNSVWGCKAQWRSHLNVAGLLLVVQLLQELCAKLIQDQLRVASQPRLQAASTTVKIAHAHANGQQAEGAKPP